MKINLFHKEIINEILSTDFISNGNIVCPVINIFFTLYGLVTSIEYIMFNSNNRNIFKNTDLSGNELKKLQFII